MFYNGNLDLICPLVATENMLYSMEWNGMPLYRLAPKLVWKVDPTDADAAGYVRVANNLIQV